MGGISKHLTVLAWLLCLPTGPIYAQAVLGFEYEFRGQLSGWTVASQHDDQREDNTGFRYLPSLSLNLSPDEDLAIDAEATVNGYWRSQEEDVDSADADIYRLWLRLASSQYEIRGGLQRIDFGSAVMLRPLMWFDRMDPRDPLGLTEGVYALLGRYYFLNNANIWVWVLLGNDETKGWERAASLKDRPEYGGRLQTPFWTGEIALSYHHREVDTDDMNLIGDTGDSSYENRFGLDGKWDVGVGLWFESALIHQEIDPESLQFKKFLNIGLDYTFDIGNGLNVIGENLWMAASEDVDDSGKTVAFSAASINYPVGLLDSASAILFYDWDNQDYYRYVSWERRYDNWRFYVMGFWNPEALQIFETERADTLFAGKGVQLLVVFNH